MGQLRTASTHEVLTRQPDLKGEDKVYSIIHIFEKDLNFFVDANIVELAPHRVIWEDYIQDLERTDYKAIWDKRNFEQAYQKQLENHDDCQKYIDSILHQLEYVDIWLIDNEPDEQYSPRRILKDFLDQKRTATGGGCENNSKSFLSTG